MERDAPPATPIRYEDLVPPPDPPSVQRVAIVGLALVAVAILLGVGAEGLGEQSPWVLATARIWLVGVGVTTAGYAVSRRPDRPGLWGFFAAAAFLGGGLPDLGPLALPKLGLVGMPENWDSFRLLLQVVAAIAAAGAGIAALPQSWRLRVASALIVVHFFGIFLATTSPSPSPWITDQIFNRLYLPYLQFVYLRNAYHFYSPEPGPASLMAFLIKTETGEREVNGIKQKTYDRRWVVFPQRPQDVKDPLGVSYFRRLSITEQVAPSVPGGAASVLEGRDIRQRRFLATYQNDAGSEQIPFHPFELVDTQYRLPSFSTTRYLLPSYAQHIVLDQTPDKETAAKTTVMMYRLEHRTMSAQDALRKVNPFSPPSYRAYFLGEYDVFGTLVNPQDQMLYWLVPVYPTAGGAAEANASGFVDYLSKHAGLEFDWRSLR